MGGNRRASRKQQLEFFFSLLLSLSSFLSFKEESLGYMYAGALKIMTGSEIQNMGELLGYENQ